MTREDCWQVSVVTMTADATYMFHCQGHAMECYRTMLDADNVMAVTVRKPYRWVRDDEDR